MQELPDMKPFFEPRGVALVGARSSPGFGYGIPIVLKYLGWGDRLYQVNPKGGELHGMPVYTSVSAVPDPVDLAVIIVPAPAVPAVLEQIGERGIRHAIVESAGFAEIGSGGKALQEEALAAARSKGIRVIGPNCVGVVNTSNRFSTVEIIDEALDPGNTAIIAQSGVFGAVMMDMLHEYWLHISKAATLGNRMDLDECDMLDYFKDDPATGVIMMYLEGAADGARLRRSLDSVTRVKPVLVLKSGRTSQGREATASHTASMSGEDDVYEAVFKQTGTVRAETLEELVEMARVFSTQPLPGSNRLAVITSSGSLGVMATDTAVASGLEVPPLSDATASRIREGAPGWMNVRNPIDVGPSPQFPVALDAALEDPEIDMVLAITVLPYAIFRAVTKRGQTGHNWFGHIEEIKAAFPAKPLVVCAVGHHDFVERMREICVTGVHVFVAPEPAVKALASLRDYSAFLGRSS
jgi:acyl-CoA synthetase (NDP forming)